MRGEYSFSSYPALVRGNRQRRAGVGVAKNGVDTPPQKSADFFFFLTPTTPTSPAPNFHNFQSLSFL